MTLIELQGILGKQIEKIRKKYIYILLAAFILSILLGCNRVKPEQYEPSKSSRFIIVETGIYYRILADKETGVMYTVSIGMYNSGNFTLLVDPDGKPLIWEDGD